MALRIEKVLFAAGEGAYYADDHDAVRAGAVSDGQAYRGSPVTPGFNSIRQPAQAMSILLRLDDGYIATGDCASVAYGGVGGREAVFQSDRAVDVASRSLKPWIEKKRIGTFRAMADELASLKDPESGKPLPLALQYGMSQALLDAVARAIERDRAARDRTRQLDAMRARVDALTPTERKVFALVVRGMLNKQIAAELGTAERTIKWHRQHIMQKLQLDSLAGMVSLAERLGLVEP